MLTLTILSTITLNKLFNYHEFRHIVRNWTRQLNFKSIYTLISRPALLSIHYYPFQIIQQLHIDCDTIFN